MHSDNMLAQMIDYQKMLFDSSFAIMSTIQDQGHSMMDMAFEKNAFVPEGGKKMRSYWVDFIKQNRENCRLYMDNSFDRIKEAFSEPGKPAAPAASKTTPKS